QRSCRCPQAQGPRVLKRIKVADVRVGMFIEKFCGSWMDHPFWKTRFLLSSERDLQRIRGSAVSELWIDTARGLDVAEGVGQSEAEVAAQTDAMLDAIANPSSETKGS